MTSPAEFLATRLGSLSSPDGMTLHFVQFDSMFAGQDTETQKQIAATAKAMSEAIVHTLAQGGYSVVSSTQLAQPARLGSYEVVRLMCSACGGRLLEVTPNPDGTVSMPGHAITQLVHQCAV